MLEKFLSPITQTNWLMLFVKIGIIHTFQCRVTTSYALSPIFFPFHFIAVLLTVIFQFFDFLYPPPVILYLLCRKLATTLYRTHTHYKLCNIHCLVETFLALSCAFCMLSHQIATVCVNTLAVQRDWSTEGELLTVCAFLNIFLLLGSWTDTNQ